MANLQIITKCPMCDLKYDKNDIKIVDKKDGAITLYMNCKKCKSSVMMLILTNILGITSISMVTDIEENELEKTENSQIECDDVLEIHKFFKNNLS